MFAFSRYVASAGAASVVDLALVQSLLLVPALHSGILFGVAIALGALAGMSVNFALSRRMVFGQSGAVPRRQVLRFFLISLSTLGLRVAVAYAAMLVMAQPFFAWVGALPIDAPATRLSAIAAMGLVTIYSFFAHKHISFAPLATPSEPLLAVR